MSTIPPTDRDRLPGLLDTEHPAEVIDACGAAAELIELGWLPKRVEFDVDTATAVVTALGPTRRVVSVSWDLRGHRAMRQQVPNDLAGDRLLALARAVASLGQDDAETGGESLTEMRWLVQGQLAVARRRDPHWRCTEYLPNLPSDAQPTPHGRAVAWLIARLVTEYGWWVSVLDIGEEVAGGGFIAEIPGDTCAIFPATMPDDGTAAAALARMMPRLCAADRDILTDWEVQDFRNLWFARAAEERRR